MSQDDAGELQTFHWMMDMLQSVDVGIVVLDRDYRIRIWNGFMESHSGRLPSMVRGKTLFELFPDINAAWFSQKAKPVFELKTRAFMTWEQRPYLFKFHNYRPITGSEPFMYQNITLAPLVSSTGNVDFISMMIYDMTDVATGKKQLEALQVWQTEEQERVSRV
ncbi:PAS domain-containing protein [Alteromonas aestuariivivens]|uniref:PAS domain-containing protein n=1 Tax=Alteromonas aestuariivivens TaxID=1938339 RepID=A0A3D8M3L6_9ALTE|nr:PAS domain-containing protein [Alteromonas aestuariivivens]RDV24337.1 PAS domain-containing protein [Alteromonas aestuariivivens]